MKAAVSFSYLLVFGAGWGVGRLYALYAQGWFDKNVWKKIDAKGWDWSTILLAVALTGLGSLYWLDHNRWNDYLDCTQQYTEAANARAPATSARDSALEQANIAQQGLNVVLYRISQTVPLDGKPPTRAEQRAAIDAYTDLGRVSEKAASTYRAYNRTQAELDAVKVRYPLPVCGPAPS